MLIWTTIFSVYIISHFFGTFFLPFLADMNDSFAGMCLPSELKAYTELNWFGAIFVSIILFILLPIYWIISSLMYACILRRNRI